MLSYRGRPARLQVTEQIPVWEWHIFRCMDVPFHFPWTLQAAFVTSPALGFQCCVGCNGRVSWENASVNKLWFLSSHLSTSLPSSLSFPPCFPTCGAIAGPILLLSPAPLALGAFHSHWPPAAEYGAGGVGTGRTHCGPYLESSLLIVLKSHPRLPLVLSNLAGVFFGGSSLSKIQSQFACIC